MTKKILSISLAISLIFISCKNFTSEPDPIGNASLRGQITLEGQPIAGALVQISDVANWKTTTDAEGRFEITRITEGTHDFNVMKTLDDNRVVSQSTSVSVGTEDTDMGIIRFPAPPVIYQIDTSEVSRTGVPLQWSRTSDPEFIEYKVYRKNVAGFDETNGDLVFASTSIADTQFIDRSFETGSYYYYRVYVFSAQGKRGGSNIVNTNTPPRINYLINSSFENSNSGILPDYWFQSTDGTPSFNHFSVSADQKKSGTRSLKITYIDSLTTPHPLHGGGAQLTQKIFTNNFVVGKNYFFSFWTKTDVGRYYIRLYKNDDFSAPILTYHVPAGQDWTENKFTFNIDANTTSLTVSIYVGGSSNIPFIQAWLDDILITE
jgi:hypothetical protein